MNSPPSPPSGRGPMLAALLVIVICGSVLAYTWLRDRTRPVVVDGESSGEATADPENPPTPAHEAAAPAHPPAKALFEGWGTPAAALVFTGEQHGYLEPCGCTSGQTGGLARRADLMRMLREDKSWPTAGFDLGGALRDERAKRPQERLKFETTRDALRAMEFAAVGLGPEELRFGADNLYTLFSSEQGAGNASPEFVCANVTLFEPPGPEYALETPLPYRVVNVGELKIGVTAVVGKKYWEKVFGADQTIDQTLFGHEPAAEALRRVLPLLQAELPDVLVLLSHADLPESRELASEFEFDLVVSAGGPEDGRQEAELVNETMVIQVGQKGKHAGVVGIFPEGTTPTLRYELVEMNGEQFAHSPVIHKLLEAYVAELDSQHPGLQETLAVEPDAPTFVGVDRCAGCHSKAYEVWKNTKHAHGFESLKTGRADDADYIVRIRDPECLCCHTVGWHPQQVARYPTGFVDEEQTPHLAGQQCENCHGAGSRHVELEDAWDGGEVTADMEAARESLRITKEFAKLNVCPQCHDPDNSPLWDTDKKPFDTFWWAEVEHVGKD